MNTVPAEGVRRRLAFLNTRMPCDSFLARDLVAIARMGVLIDLYVLDPRAIEGELRLAIEGVGGSVLCLPSPVSIAALAALLREIARHPSRLLQSVMLSIQTMLRDFEEGARALGMIGPALAVGRRMASDGSVRVHGLWAGVPTTAALWIHRHFGLPFSFSGHAYDLSFQTVLLPIKTREASAIVVCSEFAMRKLGTFMPADARRRVSLVRHGLHLADWQPSNGPPRPADPAIVLAVGRLTEKKGYRYLIEACALLRDRGCRCECRIVGPDFGQGRELERMVSRLGLQERVRLLGAVTNAEVREHMRGAAVLAVPSVQDRHGDSDGIPNVVIEAMAMGLPVVSTDAGGLSEAVQDGRTGLVVPQKDSEALARALERILSGDGDPGALKRHAREMIEREFVVEETARRFVEAVGR
jgi:glycosyltransferase involved in cell wall biosynthesis